VGLISLEIDWIVVAETLTSGWKSLELKPYYTQDAYAGQSTETTNPAEHSSIEWLILRALS
jgi:hypothetical protein